MRRPIHGRTNGGHEEEADRVPSLCADLDETLEPGELCLEGGQREIEVDFPCIVCQRP